MLEQAGPWGPASISRTLQTALPRAAGLRGDHSTILVDPAENGPFGCLERPCHAVFQVYLKDDATKGKFAFTSDDYDVFSICFNSKGGKLTEMR